MVLLDDFGKEHSCLGHHLKIWGDHYTFEAEIKGASRKARPETVIITSNYSIDDIGFNLADIEPLKRRFKEVMKLETTNIPW